MLSLSVRRFFAALLALSLSVCTHARAADDPKPKPENTIRIRMDEPVKPQTFPRPMKLFVGDVVDRSGNPQPMLVYKPRGGVFLDRLPAEILRDSLDACLKPAGLLASDRESADLLLNVYLFHFGLAKDSGLDFFSKVEFAVSVKNPKTGKSQQVTASGTSIAGRAVLKKNLQKNIQTNIEEALADAMRNLLRGVQLRDAIAAVGKPPDSAPAPPSAPPPAGPTTLSFSWFTETRRAGR